MLILDSVILGEFLFFCILLCIFSLFHIEFIPSVIRRNASKSETYVVSKEALPRVPLLPSPFPPLGFGTMLSSVALLSILVFIPSAAVVVLLLVRMGRKSAGLKKRGKSGYKKSSIEVSDE